MVIQSIVALFINTYYTEKLLNYGPLEQFFDWAPSLLIGFFMGALLIFFNTYISHVEIFELVLMIILGGAFYLFANFKKAYMEASEAQNNNAPQI